MTKKVRIENADMADYKVLVQVWDKGHNEAADELARRQNELTAMTEERDEAQSQCRSYNLYEVQLKQQLREALAACEVKDKALQHHLEQTRPVQQTLDALAIKPDATALHAWFKEQLGEPGMEFVQSPNGNYIEMKWQSMYEAKLGDKLYSSKGVEKL